MSLSALQWQFIAARLLCTSDKEAAEQIGMHHTRVSEWKKESPEFVQEYEASFSDGIHVAQELTRKHLGLAATTLAAALMATKPGPQEAEIPDYTARLKAIELFFKTHGLLTENKNVNMSGSLAVSADDLILAALAARKAANNVSS